MDPGPASGLKKITENSQQNPRQTRIMLMKDLAHTTVAEFERMMSINVTSVFLGMKCASEVMLEQGSGAIINMSSAAGMVGQTQAVAYSASKFAVRGMTVGDTLQISDLLMSLAQMQGE